MSSSQRPSQSPSSSPSPSPSPSPPKCTLQLIDFNDATQVANLVRHRKLCGWNFEPEVLKQWKTMAQRCEISMFWIMAPVGTPSLGSGSASGPSSRSTSTPVSNKPRCAGHIALGTAAIPPSPDLGSTDRSVMYIFSLFVLSEFRGHGLAKASLDILERYAVKAPYGSPRCRSIVVDTLCKRYYYDKSPEWGGVFPRPGYGELKGGSSEEMFERRGYAKFKQEGRYHLDSTDGKASTTLVVSYLRKKVA